jgi:hypothetical protein
MNRTLGAPFFERGGSGQAGWDWSKVRPTTPVKADPGLYSLSDTVTSPFLLIDLNKHERKSLGC